VTRIKLLLLLAIISSTHAPATTVFLPDARVKDLIWRGYNSESRSLALPCTEGTLQLRPIEQASFGFLYDESFESLMRENAGKASGSVNALVISGSASREFLIRKSQNDRSIHALWTFEYKKGWVSSSSPQINLLGQSASQRDREGRLATCGDSFIARALVGTKLYISASILFFSREDYQRFKTKVSASALGGLVKKSKTSIEEVKNFQESAMLSVSAMQMGSDGEKISTILGGNEILCSLNNVDDCADRYDALIRYAKSPDIYPPKPAVSLEDWPALHGVTSSYPEYGFDALSEKDSYPEINLLDKSVYVAQQRDELSQLLWEKDVLVAEQRHPKTSTQRKVEIERRLGIIQDKAEAIRLRIRLCEQGGSSDAC
jgi:hypothetical protein